MKASEIKLYVKNAKQSWLRIVFDDDSYKAGCLYGNLINENQWLFVREIDLDDYNETNNVDLTSLLNGEDIIEIIIEPQDLRKNSEEYKNLLYFKEQRKKAMEDLNN